LYPGSLLEKGMMSVGQSKFDVLVAAIVSIIARFDSKKMNIILYNPISSNAFN